MARLVEHPVDTFLRPRNVGDRFTRIEICLFRGRSLEAKRNLYRALVEALAAHDVAPEDVKIVLVEVAPEDVGLRGGQAACDVDLGYVIQV
ncbi:tautomerase family protein [Methylobacterium sp. E-046]|uniref:tautomerase family protein n=1 Tax=Methylobacterium sp. E-046 TaxID=2836576 RepID=UPI001FB88C9A|nr:tautomerase family protein [Methylobacterium sp. E-046]